MSKEQRQKSEETRATTEKKDSHYDEREREEIKWFENYERRLRAKLAESLKSRDFLNFFRNIRREYCREISSDDDYMSSSIRESEDVSPVRNVKGKRTKSLRTKQGFRSRHRKARPKRKRTRELFECPSRNYEICEACSPPYERTLNINDENPQSYARYLPNRRRSKVAYPASRLLKHYSSRLLSPNANGRYLKRNSKEWQAVDGFEVIKNCPDQRLSRIKNDREYRSESVGRPVRKSNFEESLKKRSTDSIYINPRFERGYFPREETAAIGKKEADVRPSVLDKTNESSFQKRLSGGSNFSGSTNNQYCSRLNGPSSCEEEDECAEKETRKGVNKSRSPKCEKDGSRKEERKIRGKFDWFFKEPSCVGPESRCARSRSFTSLSSARSIKGVTFEKKVSEIPSKTSRQVPKSSRKNEKSSMVEKRVHYEPKCTRTSEPRKDEETNECCFCQNERLDDKSDPRYRKLCKLVRSREGKKLLECCCCGEEQEDDAECHQSCFCPENLQIFQNRPRYDTSRSYERSWKGKDILHSTSLPGTNFGPCTSSKPVDDTNCRKKDDRSKDSVPCDIPPDVSLSDHWKKCKDRLNDFNEEYRKLSNDVKTIREIYCTRDKATRRKTERFYSSASKNIPSETRHSPRRGKDSRSPHRPNESQEIDCDCAKYLRETSPSKNCQYDRYGRSYDRCDARHELESRKKLERDSVRKLENFCDRVKAMNRQTFESKGTKTNPDGRTLNEDRTWCDCRYESEASFQEFLKPSKGSTRKEWPVDLRIVRPKKSAGKANLDKVLIYPPEGAAGPPLTLFKSSSNISCQVKGDVDHGFRYNVTYVQRFVSPCWKPVEECPANDATRRNKNEYDCSSDYG